VQQSRRYELLKVVKRSAEECGGDGGEEGEVVGSILGR
jgi:hypothetical protein